MQDLAGLLPFVLIALVFWFLIVRPQRRRAQALAATQASLEPGAEVMLGSGIFGRVVSLDDETMNLEVSPGTVVKVARQAIARVVEHDEPGTTYDGTEPVDRTEDSTDWDDRHQ